MARRKKDAPAQVTDREVHDMWNQVDEHARRTVPGYLRALGFSRQHDALLNHTRLDLASGTLVSGRVHAREVCASLYVSAMEFAESMARRASGDSLARLQERVLVEQQNARAGAAAMMTSLAWDVYPGLAHKVDRTRSRVMYQNLIDAVQSDEGAMAQHAAQVR